MTGFADESKTTVYGDHSISGNTRWRLNELKNGFLVCKFPQCGINNGIFYFFFFKNGDVLIVYTVNNKAPGPQRALISKCCVL